MLRVLRGYAAFLLLCTLWPFVLLLYLLAFALSLPLHSAKRYVDDDDEEARR